MSSTMKMLLLGIATLVLIVSILSIYLLRNKNSTSQNTIILESTIAGTNIVPDNLNLALDYLDTNNFWGEGAIASYPNSTIKLTAQEIRFKLSDSVDAPFDIQEDGQGNMVIATAVTVSEDGTVTITVALGDYFDSIDNLEKTTWIVPQFWKAISAISEVPANSDVEFFRIVDRQ